MNKFIKKLFGIDKIEEETRHAIATAESATRIAEQKLSEATEAEEKARLAKLSPKDLATEQQEPWVGVLDTKVNLENPRNGFFELDWNSYFIVQLRQAGYGFEGDPDELIVDLWFRDLARNILGEEGQDITRGAGYINVVPIAKGKSEVS
jgi:hypothetical protein